MIKRNNRIMEIGWVIPTVACCGAVREMVEISNEFAKKNHRVTIYHPDGEPVKWIECRAKTKKLSFLQTDHLDVLIGILDWQPELYEYLLNANAKLKAVCLLGFNPTEEMAAALRGEKEPADKAEKMIRDAILREYVVLADSSWQVEWMQKKVGYPAGPPFGGINLDMFFPKKDFRSREIFKFIYSGDPRDRKGTNIVKTAIECIRADGCVDIEFDSYWGKKFSQKELVKFIQKGDVFLDGHRRAGWCNPVAEAIACGTVPVATNIGANRDFAIHEQTALIVPLDDPEAMAESAIRLMQNDAFRIGLAEKGLEKIKEFAYPLVVAALEKFLYARL